MRNCFFLALLLVAISVSTSQAAIIWSETTNGPLSMLSSAPTNLGTLPLGTSTVSATVVGTPSDVDVFTFIVPTGARLDKIILAQYASSDDLAFIAMDSGPTFPYVRSQLRNGVDETQFIGGTTFGFGNAVVGTTDLLSSSLIGGRFIGLQPTPEQTTALRYDSLPPGQYTVYVQQQGGLTNYALDLVVAVPEPSSAMLLALVGLIATRVRRRSAVA